MRESTTLIAFDQHAASVMAAVLLPGSQTAAVQPVPPDLPAIGRFVERLQAAGPVRCCYEAGPCGFALERYLTTRGVRCDVSAASLIPRRPGSRVKTDRRDAAQLAVLYRAAALTVVHVPSEQEEAARDLLRCREDIRTDLLRARHRLSKFLRRHGRRWPGRAWSKRHQAWTRTQRWPLAALEPTYLSYQRAIDDAIARLRSVDEDLRALLTVEPLQARVVRLRCFRGIDDLTALTIAAELGDARRFARAQQVMGYTRLVPSEHSSGGTRQQGRITKTGNAHLRRVLVEAAWHYRHRPPLGHRLTTRHVGAPPATVACAWAAQQRLHRRYCRLLARGKRPQAVATAIARELSAFVWVALTQ
jgi:transposase